MRVCRERALQRLRDKATAWLQVGLAAGTLPPAGLLQVAETIGHADWQPELLDWRCALAAMLAELPGAMLTPQAVSALLHTSADWADFDEIAESWFEDDEHVARVVADIGGRQGAQSVDRVLAEILAPRREKWAAYFLGTALWLREALPSSSLTDPDVQDSRVRFFMEEFRSRRCSDGRSGLPAEGDAFEVP